MSSRLIIAPSVLAADWAKIAEEIAAVERAGADWLHLDVMDGHFVPPITFGADFVQTIRKLTKLPLDVHLMIDDPEKHIPSFLAAGADRITFHHEATAHSHRLVQQIHSAGKLAGIAFNPGTPYSALESILHHVDLVLVMTINPGWGGQKLIESTIEKIRAVRLMLSQMGRDIHIEVDGGINAETARRVYAAGADVLVAGPAIFQRGNRTETDYQAAIAELRAAMPA